MRKARQIYLLAMGYALFICLLMAYDAPQVLPLGCIAFFIPTYLFTKEFMGDVFGDSM